MKCLAAARTMLQEESALVGRLARVELALTSRELKEPAANVVLSGGTQLIIPFAGLVDVKKECERLATELANLEKQLTSLEARLENPGFTARAPAQVVDAERVKRDEWRTRRDLLRTRFEGLCGAA